MANQLEASFQQTLSFARAKAGAPARLIYQVRSHSTHAVGVGGPEGPAAQGNDGGGPQAAGPKPLDRPGQPSRRRRTVLRIGVEVVVLVAAALFVFFRAGTSIGNLGPIFGHLHWHWLLISAAAECGSLAALSWLQQRLLGAGGLSLRVKDLLPVTMASNAVAQSLPGGTLFAEGYAFRQYQRLGASKGLGAWAELSAGALAAAALACVALAGALLVGHGLQADLVPVLAFVAAGALGAAGLFRRTRALSQLISRVLRFAERYLPEKICRHLRSAERATGEMACFRPSAGLWMACLGAAALNWCLDAVVLVMGLLTVGAPVPWRAVLVSYAAAQLLVELPVTPGGLGIVEGGLVEVLSRFHVPVSSATAGTLMYRAFSYWFLLLVGWPAVAWLSARNRRADRQSPSAQAAGAAFSGSR